MNLDESRNAWTESIKLTIDSFTRDTDHKIVVRNQVKRLLNLTNGVKVGSFKSGWKFKTQQVNDRKVKSCLKSQEGSRTGDWVDST